MLLVDLNANQDELERKEGAVKKRLSLLALSASLPHLNNDHMVLV
jgi:hypothetical protein